MTADSAGKKRYGKTTAMPVADLASRLLEPVIARRSAMTIDLVMAWEELVGDQHAGYTMPHKINWPRRAHEDDPFRPGTLIVHCDGPRAVLFQHESSLIVERVNGFFGFTAIDAVRIVQKPVRRLREKAGPQAAALEPVDHRKLDRILSRVSDPALKANLKRLGEGMLARRGKRSG